MRRGFLAAEAVEPKLVTEALDRIAGLYRVEADAAELEPGARLACRREHSRPIVDAFFESLRRALSTRDIRSTSTISRSPMRSITTCP